MLDTDPAVFEGITGALKGTLDLVKGLKGLREADAIAAGTNDLTEKILAAHVLALSAQEAHMQLLNHTRQLEAQIASAEAWETEKQRYKLHQPWTGAFVYALKKTAEPIEPAHWICAACYQRGKKSILQRRQVADINIHDAQCCDSCGATLPDFRPDNAAAIEYAE